MEEMKALLLEKTDLDPRKAVSSLKVVTKPVPKPPPGSVLVKIEAAACNPSDILTLQHLYGIKKTVPTVPGWEACGVVVQSGGGFLANRLAGKRVACVIQADADGSWAEYMVTDAKNCFPVKAGVPTEQAAGLIVNPFSAFGLADVVKSAGYSGYVHTAGLSQVGRMLLALEKENGLMGIHMVRRKSQIPEIQGLGARAVVCFEDPNWVGTLGELCKKHQIHCGIDAVGAKVTGHLLKALPKSSAIYLYGALGLDYCGDIDPLDVIFEAKELRGFYLGHYLAKKNIFQFMSLSNRIQKWIQKGTIQTKVRAHVSLEEAPAQILKYLENMSAGKILICP